MVRVNSEVIHICLTEEDVSAIEEQGYLIVEDPTSDGKICVQNSAFEAVGAECQHCGQPIEDDWVAKPIFDRRVRDVGEHAMYKGVDDNSDVTIFISVL